MYSRQELAEGFRRREVRPGQCVMLPASVPALRLPAAAESKKTAVDDLEHG